MVVDDNGTPGDTEDDVEICTIPLLAARATDTTTCEMTGDAVAGPYTNIAVVVGTPPGGLGDVSDDDPSSYFGSAPAITLEKWINGAHITAAPGPYLLAGSEISWEYHLQNTGNVTLTGISVVDDLEGEVSCPGSTLAPLGSMVCSLTGTAVSSGQYHNTATVTATPPVGVDLNVTDDSYYFGSQPLVALEFLVNGDQADDSPGYYAPAGSMLTLDYQVSNTGNVPLTNLVVTDPSGQVCEIASLAVGASGSCMRSALAVIGQQSMQASVTAVPPAPLSNVTANDSIYYFGSNPALSLIKQTNGQDGDIAPGVYVLTGSPVNWTYTLTNDGNVALSNLTVIDDHGTPADETDDFVPSGCSDISLLPGEFVVCTSSDTAIEGQYTNYAEANGNPPAPLLPISVNDTSNYFGTTLDVTLSKQTNGFDAQTAPGPLVAAGTKVNWTYTVTNNSNVTVAIGVVDDQGVVVTCPKDSLAPLEDAFCIGSDYAQAGQYTNTATLTATPPGDLEPVQDHDTSHYFGVITGVTLQKSTNGQDADEPPGPIIKIGEPVSWTYRVTNTGNVGLTGILVTDDQPGVAVNCPGSTLEAAASMTCTASSLAVEGHYVNVGTVTANPPTGFEQVSASDTSHYFGGTASVDIEKLTNDIDASSALEGPIIRMGEPVSWTYQVTNTGNLPLENILVTDSQAGVVVSCPIISQLLSTESITCSASGVAIEGQYSNIGYVSAEVDGLAGLVYDQDTSWYFGANPSIQIIKRTNGQDANEPPGPYIEVGETVSYSYEVRNTAEFDLISVVVSDENGVLSGCSQALLLSGEVMNCQSSGVALTGQQMTTATVQSTAEMNLGLVSASDESYYFGYTLGLELVKYTNGIHVSAAPGPNLEIGEPVTWTYEVKNNSNIQLVDVSVTDDTGVPVSCPKSTLDPAETMTCSAVGTVMVGQYSNIGRATGSFNGDAVQASDVSYYFGILYHYIYLPLLLR